ncbi:hypothetical protein [uncultured Draconibacterium sp.]|uniref:hypothetical protein n=1 Tax=uncultured Draconibacterium sp. TaxID=1573823 RepID=UPI00321731E6
MFGLNEISWTGFLRFIGISLMLWYLFLLSFAWIKSRGKNNVINFEDSQSGETQFETLQPIAVSSRNFPSEIIPVNPVEDIPLQASLYEENGYAEGVAIEHFLEADNSMLALMIPDIQYHQ